MSGSDYQQYKVLHHFIRMTNEQYKTVYDEMMSILEQSRFLREEVNGLNLSPSEASEHVMTHLVKQKRAREEELENLKMCEEIARRCKEPGSIFYKG
jgi:hypothetical protein